MLMKLSFPFLVLLLYSASVWAQGGGVQSARVPVSKDAVIYGEDQIDETTRGNGRGQFLHIGNFQFGVYRRALVDFNFDGIVPPGSTILSAQFVVTPSAVTATSGMLIYRVGSRWAPGTSAPVTPEDGYFGRPAETGDPTWFFRVYTADNPARRQSWQQPGGDFVPDQPLVADLGSTQGDTVVYTSEQLLADVQSMIARPDQHFGWILLSDEGNISTGIYQFPSTDNEDETVRPYLDITFSAPSDTEKVVTNYDILDTIAGAGEKDDRDNHWRTRYEGGDAKEAELSQPATAVADTNGVVYIPDTYAHAIRRVTTDGKIETIAGTGIAGDNGESGIALEMQLSRPNGLTVLDDGNVYVLDTGNKRVCKVTPEGEFTTVFRDETEPALRTGYGLWVAQDTSSIVYSSHSALKRWTASDGSITILASGFDELANISKDTLTGDFLVTDIEDSTVWRVPEKGGSRKQIAGGGISDSPNRDALEVRLDGVRGVAAAGHGGYLLTTETGGDLWYVDTSGIADILLYGAGRFDIVDGDGQVLRDLYENSPGNIMSQPFSITVAPNGDLLMMTNVAGVLRVIRKGRKPEIVNTGLNREGDYSLTWTSQIQRLYIIENSDNLLDWKTRTEVSATGNRTSFSTIIDEDTPQQHFRVRLYYP